MVKNSFAVWVCCYLLLDSVSCHIMCHETESSSKQQQTAMYVISVEHYNVYSRESKGGGTKHRASPPLQKVGGHVPLSTHGSTPMGGRPSVIGRPGVQAPLKSSPGSLSILAVYIMCTE